MSSPNLIPIKNPSFREQFRETANHITAHRDLVDSPAYTRAVHFGLLEFQSFLSGQVRDGNSSVAVGYKLQGAFELLSIMRNLAEPAPVLQRLADRGLNHQA